MPLLFAWLDTSASLELIERSIIGSDARFGLNLMRHLPPPVYEALIYQWIAWNLVKPAQA